MSAISVQDSIPSLNSRPAGLFTATTTPTGLGPTHTGTTGLEQLTDSSNNHNFTAVSVVNGAVQNLSQTLPRFFNPSFSILSSAVTSHSFTSALGALTVITIIMCSFILLYHPCRHNRPMRMDCKDAMARRGFLRPPTSKRSRLHHRRPLPSSTSTHVPGGRFIRARSTSRSRSPSPEPQSDSASSARITSRSRSSNRLAAGRTNQNPREPRVLCPNYRTVRGKTSALCFKPDCEFERVNRCWRCCQCNRGPNRQSRCTSSARQAGGEGTTLSKKCTHDVCSDCTEYVFPPIPIYISAVGDWIKPPASTVTLDAVTDDGDTTESEDEEEEGLILDLMDLN
ncbi:hypothetical protein QBC43DRAFT_290609 [Cladorrhinum sp. PSN259]|nr:hypothetical protein QBC43DRAFT_290609 [Cladorrhinum sp. PSN259]